MNNWIVTKSSAIGTSHLISGLPCQDSCYEMQSHDGEWLSIVVSDGAGTAKYSDQSSSLVSKSFAKALISLSEQFKEKNPGAWVNDFVIEQILNVRNELRSLAKEDSLKDFHCTLVACLLGKSGGFLIHIGDGAVFGGLSKETSENKISLSESLFISRPENGEYANETFFITEGDWIKHLRITPIGLVDWIVLATDGGTSLSMIEDKEPKLGFIAPLFGRLTQEENQAAREAFLNSVLNDAQANKLTSDDKTLCIAFRQNLMSGGKEIEANSVQTTTRLDESKKTQTQLESPISITAIKPRHNKILIPKLSAKHRKIVLITLTILVGICAGLFSLIALNR